MKTRFQVIAISVLAMLTALCASAHAQSTTGVYHPATDGLGRALPTHDEVGDLRPGKTVAMFFWTWHSGQSVTGYNYDLTKIITTPDMINDYDHPNWAAYPGGPFWWAEPLFGFHDGKDPWVARKQLEMLGAAGVDVLFYDCTNGDFTWKEGYENMAEAMTQAIADGVKVPQFAFMMNFSPQDTTALMLGEVYKDMYSVGRYEESWFRWQGKPVVMAYRESVGTAGDTAGLQFTAASPFTGIDATCPSWANDIGDLTLALYEWTGDYAESVTRPALARQTFVDFPDNAQLALEFGELPAGDYVWELSGAREIVGVWKYDNETAGVVSYFNGAPVSNDYESRIRFGAAWSALTSGPPSHSAIQIVPAQVNSQPDDTAGLRFTASASFTGIDASCPSWGNSIGDLTLSLYTWAGNYDDSVAQAPLASQTFVNYNDNARLMLEFAAQPAGEYVWELSEPRENVGAWKFEQDTAGVRSYVKGSQVSGDFDSRIKIGGGWTPLTSGSSQLPVQLYEGVDDATLAAVLNFFTFRPGQPAYNTGPSRNDQWGWLENAPQHGYVEKAPGEYEWMTVGVAQNWREDTEALTAMNAGPAVHGRSFTDARQFADLTADSYLYGYNFQEQWDRALAVDPDIVFITGWNEFIAGRYDLWGGVENAFPDQFSPEYSRDIEPSRGYIKDHYYYQMIANIRRFKGMPAPERASEAKTIGIDGAFTEWADVAPHFTDSRGDALVRDGYGYIDQDSPTNEYLHYTNDTARNDIIDARVSHDWRNVYFYVEAAAALTSHADPNWMLLLIDGDRNKATGWEGYEWRVAGYAGDSTARLESSSGAWSWTPVGQVTYRVAGAEMELAIPRSLIAMPWPEPLLDFEFKWFDTPAPTGDIMEVYTDGDAAPNGRFNYRYLEHRVNKAHPRWMERSNETD